VRPDPLFLSKVVRLRGWFLHRAFGELEPLLFWSCEIASISAPSAKAAITPFIGNGPVSGVLSQGQA